MVKNSNATETKLDSYGSILRSVSYRSHCFICNAILTAKIDEKPGKNYHYSSLVLGAGLLQFMIVYRLYLHTGAATTEV